MRLLALRGEWSRIAGTPDASIALRGRSALREELHLVRGEARLRAGDWKGALEDWRKAPRLPAAERDRLFIKHMEEEELGRVPRLPASGPSELARLAGLFRDAGERELAAELLREAVREAGRPEDRNDLAWTLLETAGGREEALREARLAASALPEDGYAKSTLALALLRNGDRAGAERAWREAIELLPPGDYRVGASLRARLALLLAESPDRARREEALSWGAEALRLDYETVGRLDLLRLLAEGGRQKEIAGIASREGDLRDRALRIEGKPPIGDAGRGIYLDILRDLGYEHEEIDRLQEAYLPRIDTGHAAARGRAPGRKDDR
jgi:tetratricopeptide (TPR) repeat protein